MKSPSIRINIDPPETIKKLYGVGIVLANRIVEHRDKYGYFQNPEELAQVDGVSIEMASTLTPHIDWSYPPQGKTKKESNRSLAIFLTAMFVGGTPGIIKQSQKVLFLLSIYDSGFKYPSVYVWINVSILIAQIALQLVLVFLMVSALTIDTLRAKKLSSAALSSVVLFILASISSGLGNIVYYQFTTPDGWQELLSNKSAIMGLNLFLACCLCFAPLLVFWFKPSPALKVKLAKAFDIIILSFGLTFSILGYLSPNMGIIDISISVFFGVFFFYIGITSIRSGDSAFFQVTKLFSIQESSDLPDNLSWLTWLNSRLPNIEQQKELKKALDAAYPPSKTRTILSSFLVAIGGWLIITVANSLIDWLIQGWLNRILPWFK